MMNFFVYLQTMFWFIFIFALPYIIILVSIYKPGNIKMLKRDIYAAILTLVYVLAFTYYIKEIGTLINSLVI